MRGRSVVAVVAASALLALGAGLHHVLAAPSAPPAVLTDLEIGFAQDMTAHHQQAVNMAERLDPAVDPAVRRLARRIADTQRLEIGTMLGWLRLADAPSVAARPMAWMPQHRHDGSSAMPGMATLGELAALSEARGPAAETVFLQLMIRHHEGGILMAQAAADSLTSGPVLEAARGMLHAQSREVGLMNLMLRQRGVEPLTE